MILVDNRAGSKELFPLFPRGKARLTRLEYGDFAFEGNGPDSIPWLIGIERKTIGDLTQCIGSGRMSGNQLEGLVNGYNTVYVVVEGRFKADAQGVLVTWGYGEWKRPSHGRQFMLRDVFLFLHTLENVVGLKTWRTGSREETAEWIMGLHQWWTVKEWDEHHGHQQPHTRLSPDLVPHSFERKVAGCLKGVGWARAKAIADSGYCVGEMVGLQPESWREIEGIGEVLSKSIVNEFWGIR
jgi:ERCC4-type nuclease